ncbi:MAG TPA: hypothetical protein PKH79_07830 [Prolixibacteraceae bacterium]|nr:hypothetical protein [Prolixibacteraceae bacterium]HPS12970.1 hypothetical protein [Prolixibacteraceae bacterium]
MSFSTQYKTLFEVNILHFFFLNKGANEFFSMDDSEKTKQLDHYNLNDFFKITPTTTTQKLLNGSKLLFKTFQKKISVITQITEDDETKPFIPLSDDLSLTFLLQTTDSRFFNYTNLNINDTGKIYYFSNRILNTEPGTFPLIQKNGDTGSVDETHLLSEESTKKELSNLNAKEKEQLFGIIRIFMKGETSTTDVTDPSGNIKTPCPTFQILFSNRKTFWRYIFRQEQTVTESCDVEFEESSPKILTTKVSQPLTEIGFVSIKLRGKELPNPNSNLIKSNTTGDRFYSEIYM